MVSDWPRVVVWLQPGLAVVCSVVFTTLDSWTGAWTGARTLVERRVAVHDPGTATVPARPSPAHLYPSPGLVLGWSGRHPPPLLSTSHLTPTTRPGPRYNWTQIVCLVSVGRLWRCGGRDFSLYLFRYGACQTVSQSGVVSLLSES